MSDMSISMAGSVAQSAVQAQQVGRALHRHNTDAAAEAKRLRERLDAHFAALDEGDEAELISQLRVDDQVPQRDHSAQDEPRDERQAQAEEAVETPQEQAVVPEQPPISAYRPLDVTA